MNQIGENKSVPVVWVAVGVVWDLENRVLIALRKPDAHQGNIWEFPGGKVEKGEDAQAALIRELQEEVGVTATTCEPFMKIEHEYPQCRVLLDVWHVRDFTGTARGLEGQETRWITLDEFQDYTFPAGNQEILAALQKSIQMDH